MTFASQTNEIDADANVPGKEDKYPTPKPEQKNEILFKLIFR